MLQAPGVTAALAIAVAVFAPAGGQALHLHEDVTAGYYNEQHVLVSLATLRGDAPVPDMSLASWFPLASTPGPPVADVRLPLPVARSTDPRAPPLA